MLYRRMHKIKMHDLNYKEIIVRNLMYLFQNLTFSKNTGKETENFSNIIKKFHKYVQNLFS